MATRRPQSARGKRDLRVEHIAKQVPAGVVLLALAFSAHLVCNKIIIKFVARTLAYDARNL